METKETTEAINTKLDKLDNAFFRDSLNERCVMSKLNETFEYVKEKKQTKKNIGDYVFRTCVAILLVYIATRLVLK